MQQKTLTFTGHRPQRLKLGFDIYHEEWNPLKTKMKQFIIDRQITDVWSGMALGTDTIAAIATLELKEERYDIKLHCAIPCRNYHGKWSAQLVNVYNSILEKADEVVYVKDGEYDEFCLSHRNYYMVDKADEVFAVWDEKSYGGTYEAVAYAKYKGIPVYINTVS